MEQSRIPRYKKKKENDHRNQNRKRCQVDYSEMVMVVTGVLIVMCIVVMGVMYN